MGAKVAKPNPPKDNEAKANADVALKGLEATADQFLLDCRLGVVSGNTLGYDIVGQKLQNFEKRMVVQTTVNAPKEDIAKAVHDIFSGDWEDLVTLCVDQLASFFGGEAPKPSEKAVYEVFAKGYLKYEFSNLVQYSVQVVKTNCTSTGTLLADTGATLMAVVCSGIVDYAKVDPQATIYNIQKSQPGIKPEELNELLDNIGQAMKMASKLATLKKQLEDGTLDPGTEKKVRVGVSEAGEADEVAVYSKKLQVVERLQRELATHGRCA